MALGVVVMEFVRRLWLSAAVVAAFGAVALGLVFVVDSCDGEAPHNESELAGRILVEREGKTQTVAANLREAAIRAGWTIVRDGDDDEHAERVRAFEARSSRKFWGGLGLISLGPLGVFLVYWWGRWLFSPPHQ